MRDEYELTDSIQILIDYDYPVRIAPVVRWDVNVTYIDDLVACCVHVLRERGQRSLTGAGCEVAEGVELVDSVLGDGARIRHPIRLERCVVMPGVTVDSAYDLKNVVITPEAVLQAEGSR